MIQDSVRLPWKILKIYDSENRLLWNRKCLRQLNMTRTIVTGLAYVEFLALKKSGKVFGDLSAALLEKYKSFMR